MKTNRTPEPTRTENPLLRLFVETLSQQHRDLEAGVAMYRSKNGPPEEAERLRDRARRMQKMFAQMKKELGAVPVTR